VDMEAAQVVDSLVPVELVVAPMARVVALAESDPERIALLVVLDVGAAEAAALCPTWALARGATRWRRHTSMSAMEEISGVRSEISLAFFAFLFSYC